MADEIDDWVGTADLAERLQVARNTVHNWRCSQLSAKLPEPRRRVGQRKELQWSWSRDIEPWARRTRRLLE